ncbi:hypothetical protein MTR_4g083600 [Medicago truncatula]|uniref:Uncharacterized protein n=1 Tax=Medicago truncatula TaxID=3880 RepID=G7JIR2_MEDTR|nr:hypothetical protein MTR_4g083600 [Medicago truncatula]
MVDNFGDTVMLIIILLPKSVKTDGPARLGLVLTGFGFYRVGSKNPVGKRA